MSKISEIAKSNNKALEQRLIQSIGKHSELDLKPVEHHEEVLGLVHDDIFNLPINELSQTQKSNFKKLIDEI